MTVDVLILITLGRRKPYINVAVGHMYTARQKVAICDILPIMDKAYKLSVMVYHCIHGTAPKYLCDLCTLVAYVASRRQLRSASQNILLVPRYKRSGLGQRAFSVAGPLVWNSIADCLRDPALELASFKRQLKTFLFARY